MTTQAIGNSGAPAIPAQVSSSWTGLRQDFKGLQTSLLNGDLNAAQSSFASLQQAVSTAQTSAKPNSILSQLGQPDSPLGQDFQAVSSALGASDVSGAQDAFAKLQQDMESARHAGGRAPVHHTHHGHHAKGGDGGANEPGLGSTQSSSTSQSTAPSAEDVLNALQSLASSNPKIAGDLGTLISDLSNIGKVVNTKA